MKNPLKTIASWILKKEIKHSLNVLQFQEKVMLRVHNDNQELLHMNMGLKIQVDKLTAELEGKIH